MTEFRRNPSPSPSISSMISDVASELSSEEAGVRNFVKKKLVKRLFLGHYQERRYVECLCVYRDMVVLHKSESNLITDVDMVQSKLRCFYGEGKWLGITSPDIIGAPAAGHCLWTKLQDVAFGFYWFQIRQIRIEDREIFVRLKVIRQVDEEMLTPSLSSTSITKSLSENVDTLKHRIRSSIHSLTEASCLPASQPNPSSAPNDGSHRKKYQTSNTKEEVIKSPAPDSTSSDNPVQIVKEPLRMEDFLSLFRLMLRSWREIFLFLSSVLVGIFSSTGKCIEYTGNFALKFMREVNHLLCTLTPIVLAVIELVGKIIGGLYLLLAMLVQGRNRQPPRQFAQSIQNRRPLQALQYQNYPPSPPGMSQRRF